MTTAAVKVEGLREVIRGFDRMGDDLRRGIRAELKDAADIVADEAKRVAFARGLIESGQLIRSIKPAVRGRVAVVRATARRGGYAYGGRYEFGDRLRPFLSPALEHKRGEVEERVLQLVDRTLSRFEEA